MVPLTKKFTHSFCANSMVIFVLFYIEITKVRNNVEVWSILYFFPQWLASCPNTIYQKFHLFLSHMQCNFNHKTNDMNCSHVYYFCTLYSTPHFPPYFYAEMNCVIVKVP